MHFLLAMTLAVAWSESVAQNNTVRYEPLKNKNIDADYEAWEKGTEHYVRSYGLMFEWLEVTTDDDVKLKIHHLWSSRINGTRIPVLVLPPLTCSGDIFFMNRPEGNFIMTLANQGYDVFLANHRASGYCPIPREKYDNTTLDHFAFSDVPAIFDKVLNYTKQPKLHLIGFSRGTTISFAFLSKRVEYNDKIRLLILICPISFLGYPIPSVAFLMSAVKVLTYVGGTHFTDAFDTNLFLDIFHRKPVPEILQSLMDEVPVLGRCFFNLIYTGKPDCVSELNMDSGIVRKFLTRGFPDRVNSRELIQYAQNSISKSFQSYSPAWLNKDLGAFLFDRLPDVEKYSLKNVTCPVSLLQAEIELFSQAKDNQRIRNELCSRIISGKLSPQKYAFEVTVPNYQHADPVVSRNNDRIYANAFYMIMREFDISLDPSLQSVLGYIDADFSHLIPQTCESSSSNV